MKPARQVLPERRARPRRSVSGTDHPAVRLPIADDLPTEVVAVAKPRRWPGRLLFAFGTIPVVAGLGYFVARDWIIPVVRPPAPVVIHLETRPADFDTIDAVLAKRAPELGLTLRHQLGIAIAEESRRAGYDPLLILSIINVESDFDEVAISPKGARGLMQIQPTTLYFLARTEGLRLSREEVAADPALQVRLGIRYLRALNDRFGSLDLALMAYNAGPAKIRHAMLDHSLDFFRTYPALVRRGFRQFREGEGLGGDWALARREERPAAAAPVP